MKATGRSCTGVYFTVCAWIWQIQILVQPSILPKPQDIGTGRCFPGDSESMRMYHPLQPLLLFSRSVMSTETSCPQSLSHRDGGVSVTPQTVAHQVSLSFTISWSLLKLMSIESVMPSNHCILCCPLLILLSVFPCIGVFSNAAALVPPKRTRSYDKLSLGIQRVTAFLFMELGCLDFLLNKLLIQGFCYVF